MSDTNIYEAAYDAAEDECKALRAENERLREALTKLINAVDPSLPLKLYRAIAHARTTLAKEAGK